MHPQQRVLASLGLAAVLMLVACGGEATPASSSAAAKPSTPASAPASAVASASAPASKPAASAPASVTASAPAASSAASASAKPAASAASKETILYADDFKNPAAGKLSKSVTGSASGRLALGYVEGEYMIKVLQPDEVIQFETVPGSFPSAALAVDARVVGTVDNNRGVALKCRRQSGAVSDYTLIVRPGPGYFGLFRKDRQDIIPLVAPQESAAIKKGTATNRLQLACAGSTMTVTINGTDVASVQDATYPMGQFTFGAEAADVPPWPLAPGLTNAACFTTPQPTCAPTTVEVRFANLVVSQR